jgi:hypothetical protein
MGTMVAKEPSASRWCTGVDSGSTPSSASSALPARTQALLMRSAVDGPVDPGIEATVIG